MNKKKVTVEITHESWKALKILAVQKEVSLQMVVAEILEKSMKKRLVTNNVAEMAPDTF